MSDDLKKIRDALAQIDYALDTIVYMLASARLGLRRLETADAIEMQTKAPEVTKP